MSEQGPRINVCLTPGAAAEQDRNSHAITFSVDVYFNGELQGTGPLVLSTIEAELLDARLRRALSPVLPPETHGMVG